MATTGLIFQGVLTSSGSDWLLLLRTNPSQNKYYRFRIQGMYPRCVMRPLNSSRLSVLNKAWPSIYLFPPTVLSPLHPSQRLLSQDFPFFSNLPLPYCVTNTRTATSQSTITHLFPRCLDNAAFSPTQTRSILKTLFTAHADLAQTQTQALPPTATLVSQDRTAHPRKDSKKS